MTVCVDTAAAAATPTDSEIAQWASDQRVFISSVMTDMIEERRSVAMAIRAVGAIPVWFEEFHGMDEAPQGAYLAHVESSAIYVGILARRYGDLMDSRLSATHDEYRTAERLGKRICVWVHADEDFQGDQLSFVKEVRRFHTTGSYASPEDLASRVEERLRRVGAEELTPWVKLGDAIFRAKEVADNGQEVTIQARLHSADVIDAIESMRPTPLARHSETLLTYSGISGKVRVKEVTTRRTSSRTALLDIILSKQNDRVHRESHILLNVNSFSSDEITEIAIRSALFGQAAPDQILSVSGGIGDPLSRMSRHSLPTETYSAVLGLLVTEDLISSGRVSRVTQFKVGPLGPEGRRLKLEWVSPAAYGQSGNRYVVEDYVQQ